MSACLTLRSEQVLHCLSKLSGGELVQVNASSALYTVSGG